MLDLGNAGTGARLLMGLVASHPITTFFTGDALAALAADGAGDRAAEADGRALRRREGGRLPLAVIGTGQPVPITYRLPVASAQVKSAILLAGLNTPGDTTVIEPEPTRDHTELMLRHFGATVRVEATPEGRRSRVDRPAGDHRPAASRCRAIHPPPPSRLVAALIVPGSDVTLPDVGLNPLRTGLIETLREMGADIAFREPARRSRRAGRRPPRARGRAEGRRGAGRARAVDDRRISDPRGGRRLAPRAARDARPGRTARQGERPAGRDGARPRAPAASRSRTARTV